MQGFASALSTGKDTAEAREEFCMTSYHKDYDRADGGDDDDDDDFEMHSYVPYYVEPGLYPAEFTDWKRLTTQYGERCRWIFKLTQKKHKGNVVDGLGPLQAGDKNNSGKILRGLTGQPLDPQKGVKIKKLFGTTGQVVVEDGDKPNTCKVVGFVLPNDDDDDDDE